MTRPEVDEIGKLFIGGLSWETTTESLKAYFSQYGEVVDTIVMRNNETGRPRGFGFVTFKDPSCNAIVLATKPHSLDGKLIDVKECTPRNNRKGGGKKMDDRAKVFLGGLAANITEDMLREEFSNFGNVLDVNIMYDSETKKPRGFGFLTFECEDSVDEVCAQHYVTISNKQIECKRAQAKNTSRRNQYQNSYQDAQYNMGAPGGNFRYSSQPAPMSTQTTSGYGDSWTAPVAHQPRQYGTGWSTNVYQQPYVGQSATYGNYQNWTMPASSYSSYGAVSAQTSQQASGVSPMSYGYTTAATVAQTSYGDTSFVGQGDSQMAKSQAYHPYRR